MRWPVFAILAYFFLAMELGLTRLLEVGSGVAPSFVLVLMVFIAAHASTMPALWAALILGALVDLTSPLPYNRDVVIVLGPHAMGYLLGALLTLQLRSLVYRRHPLMMAFLTLCAGLTVHILAVFLLSVRHLLGAGLDFYAPFVWSSSDELVHRFLVVLYTAMLAVPVNWILQAFNHAFGFQSHPRMGHIR